MGCEPKVEEERKLWKVEREISCMLSGIPIKRKWPKFSFIRLWTQWNWYSSILHLFHKCLKTRTHIVKKLMMSLITISMIFPHWWCYIYIYANTANIAQRFHAKMPSQTWNSLISWCHSQLQVYGWNSPK